MAIYNSFATENKKVKSVFSSLSHMYKILLAPCCLLSILTEETEAKAGENGQRMGL